MAYGNLDIETTVGMDLDRFVAISGQDEEDVAALVAFYLTYLTEQLDALRAAINGGRTKEVEFIAHRCAGSSATYGMEPIVGPLAAIERQAHNGDLHGAFALERDARAAFADIEIALRSLVAGASTRKASGAA
jgi:HPt (histidine-containing phosphotransfer) domain-containing protein